jgi:uncharacterized protein (TIGR02145 family)
MSFDGVDDYVDIGTPIQLTENNDATINIWMSSNTYGPNSMGEIFDVLITNDTEPTNSEFILGINQQGYIYIQTGDGGASGSTIDYNSSLNVLDGFWHNIVVTKKPISNTITSELVVYLDGINVKIDTVSGNWQSSINDSFFIGVERTNGHRSYLGLIDDVAIFDYTLDQQEIQAYMSCPPTGNESGLVGCWDFDEGEGDTVYDLSENGNDGIINGATWSTDVPEQSCQSDCTDFVACNYNPDATEDDGSCDYTCCPGPGCCSEGLYWDWDLQECFITNPSDINLDGCVQLDDLLDLLSAYGDCGAPSFICGDPVDHQGYSYSTVLIGEQCWFKENCRYLPDVTDSSVESFTEPLYYVYDYEGDNVLEAKQTSNYEDFGVLYNFVAATSDNICPSEWHPPTELEFLELIDFAGGPEIAGDALKAEEGWADSYIEMQGSNGSNSSGFTAVPNGYFSNATGFNRLYTYGWMWTSTSIGELNGRYLQLFTHTETAGTTSASNFYGFSARCIKD